MVDVRQLSLAQLQALVERGSQRARQELQARMAAPPPPVTLPSAAPPRSAAIAPPMPLPSALAGLDDAPAAGARNTEEDPRIRQLQFLEQQDSEDTQARGLPRLIGLTLMGWGGLLLFSGLVMLAYMGASFYYMAMGVATMAVGWLLLRDKFWVIYLQLVIVLIAFGWAWVVTHSIAGMLAQAAPVWISACWTVFPQVREPLG